MRCFRNPCYSASEYSSLNKKHGFLLTYYHGYIYYHIYVYIYTFFRKCDKKVTQIISVFTFEKRIANWCRGVILAQGSEVRLKFNCVLRSRNSTIIKNSALIKNSTIIINSAMIINSAIITNSTIIRNIAIITNSTIIKNSGNLLKICLFLCWYLLIRS